MSNSTCTLVSLASVLLTLCASTALAQNQDGGTQQNGSSPAEQESRSQVQAQARPEIEQQKKDAEGQAKGSLDKDAVAVIEDTKQALKAISQNKTDEAIAAMERATGKVNTLMGHNPATALLPVQVEVQVIDTAPVDVQTIRRIAKSAQTAVDTKDYPRARLLLTGLISEIRVRTYHLPLATYPTAMRNAVQLLDQKKPKEAAAILDLALNTLVIVDQTKPLPLTLAQTAINEADSVRDKDKQTALNMLSVARNELDRSRELGYAGEDPEYPAVASAISDLEKNLKGGGDTQGAFAKLKERIASFFKRQSDSQKSAVASER